MGRRRAGVLLLVHALLALHIVHWMRTGSSLSPLEPSEAMEFSKHDLVNAGLVFFGLTILSTLVLGRWFCGWACHLVALQDLSLWLLRKLGIRPQPLRSRVIALVPAGAALYMFVYPLAHRWWQGTGFGPARVALTKTDFWATFPPWPVALATFLVCGFVAIYFLGAKGFCTYACPYGAIFGLADRFAVGRIRVTDACEGCAHCTATCTSNVVVHEEVRRFGMVVDPGCMKCMDCISVCPKEALYFGFGRPSLEAGKAARRSRARYSWREELLLASAFALVFFAFRGLYGVIPFLLALALAAILATSFAALVQLPFRSALGFLGRSLKREGRLTGAGVAFALAMTAVSALLVHSALIQVHAGRSTSSFASTAELREALLTDPSREPDPRELALMENALRSAAFVERHGLLPTPGNELRLAWFRLLADWPEVVGTESRPAPTAPPDAASWHFDLGRFHEVRGQLEEASAQYEASVAAVPGATAFDRLARSYFVSGKYEQALGTYLRALGAFPDNPDLQFNLGVAEASMGHLDQAERAFRRVLELDPGRQDALENLAALLHRTGRDEEALETERLARARRP